MTFPTIGVDYNITNVTDVFGYANTVTSGIFMPFMLVVMYVVVYLSLSSATSSEKAFAATGFFGSVIAILLFTLGLITEMPLILSIVLAIGSFVMLMFNQET